MEQNPNDKKSNAHERKTTLAATVAAIIILLILTLFFGYHYFSSDKKMKEAKIQAKAECQNQKNLDFALLFIDKVLQANNEIDFDTRLTLENSVRSLDDKEILVQWQKFTSAQDEKDAQDQVKNLLRLLIEKTKTN